jgi:hypothetical protein
MTALASVVGLHAEEPVSCRRRLRFPLLDFSRQSMSAPLTSSIAIRFKVGKSLWPRIPSLSTPLCRLAVHSLRRIFLNFWSCYSRLWWSDGRHLPLACLHETRLYICWHTEFRSHPRRLFACQSQSHVGRRVTFFPHPTRSVSALAFRSTYSTPGPNQPRLLHPCWANVSLYRTFW